MKPTRTTRHKTLIQRASQRLLAENEQLLFLPLGTEGQADSHGEPYLECDCPEGSISLNNQSLPFPLHICGGGPITEPILLHHPTDEGSTLPIPAHFETDPYRYISELPPEPAQKVHHFLNWIQTRKPQTKTAIIHYFLYHQDVWLIGLKPNSPSISLFNTRPINHPNQTPSPLTWHRISKLIPPPFDP